MKIENDGKTLTLTIPIDKGGYISSTGVSIVLFTTRKWENIGGGLLLSCCVIRPFDSPAPLIPQTRKKTKRKTRLSAIV